MTPAPLVPAQARTQKWVSTSCGSSRLRGNEQGNLEMKEQRGRSEERPLSFPVLA
jgi:hypothetical protein